MFGGNKSKEHNFFPADIYQPNTTPLNIYEFPGSLPSIPWCSPNTKNSTWHKHLL